jgi:hypothetical protein
MFGMTTSVITRRLEPVSCSQRLCAVGRNRRVEAPRAQAGEHTAHKIILSNESTLSTSGRCCVHVSRDYMTAFCRTRK